MEYDKLDCKQLKFKVEYVHSPSRHPHYMHIWKFDAEEKLK